MLRVLIAVTLLLMGCTLKLQTAADHSQSTSESYLLKGDNFSFQVVYQVEKEKDLVQLLGLAPIGGRLFTITYQNKNLTYEPSPLFRAPMKPDQLLYCVQLLAEQVTTRRCPFHLQKLS